MNKGKLLFFLLMFFLSGFATAQQPDSAIYLSHHLNNGLLNIETSAGLVQVLAYTPQIIEVKKFSGNLPVIDSGSTIVIKPQNPKLTVEDDKHLLLLKTEELTIVFHKNPFYTTFVSNDTLLKEKNGTFDISDNETFYGLGWNADFPLKQKQYQLNSNKNRIPVLISSKQYLLLFENPQNGFIKLNNQKIEWSFNKKTKHYFFVGGNDFKELLTARKILIGSKPLSSQNIPAGSSISWQQLQSLLPKMLNAGISGYPYFKFTGDGYISDKEPVTSLRQLAALTSIEFKRGSKSLLRSRLEPYIKSLWVQAQLKGYPMVRPLFIEFPNDKSSLTISNEFMLGKQLLVAPVLKKGEKIRSIYLPQGNRWYNYFTNRKLPGGRDYNISVTISDIPLFVRAGAFLPMFDDSQNLTVRYYMSSADERQTFVMYKMNNENPEAVQKGKFETLMLIQKPDVRGNPTFMFSYINRDFNEMPAGRNVKLEIIGFQKVDKLMLFLNGVKMKRKKTSKKGNGYYYDKEKKIWVAEFEWTAGDAILTTKVKN